ncbi:hypothetical protein NE865_11808 [Phthorimaea operculella]|nr:hypothetical protein NE865_11808 [Phthorimaea operculella]
MALEARRAEDMLFNYETTTRADYRESDLPPVYPPPKEKPKSKEKPRPFVPPKYVGCMTDWKSYLPFNIHHKPKEVLQTYPLTPQPVFEKLIDEQREAVQKTRPRLVMTPAFSLDDVTNPEDRDILIKSMYSTEMKQKMEEAADKCVSIKAPMPDFPAPASAVYLPKLKSLIVPREWRMDSVTWDNRQLRSAVDTTHYFWTRPEKDRFKCYFCEQTERHADSCRHRRMNRCNNM